jgi:hypothetical protein
MLGYSNAQTALYTGGTQVTVTGNAFASFFLCQTNTGKP